VRSRDRARVEVSVRKTEPESDSPGKWIVRPPTYEEIQQRAVEVHFERRGTHGFEVDDWLEARRELLVERFGPQ
jgi:hypothetical protein